jgi:hypothetical protein
LSDAHFPVQEADEPLQRLGEHEGDPSEPAARSVQVPTVTLQVSHAPVQALLQQYPSTQLPVAQARHPACRQSVVRLQLWACVFRGRHCPFAAQ